MSAPLAHPPIPRATTLWLTALAMLAFAGNSLLCRLALKETTIDPASFTAVRLIAGALTLWLIVRVRSATAPRAGSWASAAALFAYAVFFSYAYVSLSAATGALLLFASVQVSMISYGFWRGERFGVRRWLGFACATGGLVGLLLPGLSAPPLDSAGLMIAAGIAWGVYSLRGRGAADPLAVTAGNFLRSVPLALLLVLSAMPWLSQDVWGLLYAVLSGALASGVGYAIWYTALRGLKATSAATVQLSVPVITALGGVALLSEVLTLRLVLTSVVILGGIALVILEPRPTN